MSNVNVHSSQIGLRIRTARKAKGLNQTELASKLGKSLRTIQKYESGEIEVSIAMINEIAKVLECESTYLMGYDTDTKPLSNLSDILQFFFKLDRVKDLNFEIEVNKPPNYDGWECAVKFNGKDKDSPLNQDLCLFLEQMESHRESFRIYQTRFEEYAKWQDKTMAYHSSMPLEEKEIEEISDEERIQRFQAIMNERYGK